MNKQKLILLSTLATLAVAIIGNIVHCNNFISVKNYSVKTDKLDTNIHFVLLSDLHNREFGKDNRTLISKVKEQNPDFIAVCGDMVTRNNDDYSVMKSVLTNLSKIAPTYFVLGNHERDLARTIDIDYESIVSSTGAIFLDNKHIEFEKNGESFLIGGLSDYPYYEEYYPDYDNPERHFWDKFNESSKDSYSILLHHQPEYIAGNLNESNVDLILCGHTHGGLVQIPFVGGLIAPNQGFFPEYDKGEYEFDGTKMIISAGLSGSHNFPRINNQIEICVVDIT